MCTRKSNRSASVQLLFLLLLAPLAMACPRKASEGPDEAVAPAAQSGGNASAGATATNGNAVALPPVAPVCRASAADINVVIASKVGPKGAALVPFTAKHRSLNLDDLKPGDYSPALDANFVALMKALKPAMLRWPAGYDSQTYQFDASGAASTGRVLTPAFLSQYLALCQAVGAEPFVGINTLDGTADNAAALVTWLNKTKGAKVRYFHIGNEPDVDPTNAAATPATYAATFQQFRAAMLAVDPCIKLVGAELTTGARVIGAASQPNWLGPILAATASTPMDAIAWHYYPKDSSQTLTASSAYPSPANLLLETASDWPPAGLNFAGIATPLIRSARDALAPKAEIWVDEFAEDSGKLNGVGLGDRAVGPLWVADALGRYVEEGTDAIFRFIFKTGEAHGYALLDPNNVPRPDYYAMWLYANAFGDALCSAKSSAQDKVATHAAITTKDGSLQVMLVNKTETTQNVLLDLTDFAPVRATRYRVAGASFTDANVTLNGKTLTAQNVDASGPAAIAPDITTDACAKNVVVLPPASTTVYNFSR